MVAPREQSFIRLLYVPACAYWTDERVCVRARFMYVHKIVTSYITVTRRKFIAVAIFGSARRTDEAIGRAIGRLAAVKRATTFGILLVINLNSMYVCVCVCL